MRIILVDKKEEPLFRFYVKENNSQYDYYAYDDIEMAMEKARTLSLEKYPIIMVFEKFQTSDREWKFRRIFMYYAGKCEIDNQIMLHAKFYLDAGECLNITKLKGE